MQQDPRDVAPRPPFPEQRQEFPGIEGRMEPRPDYGEMTYRGSERLTGKVALITGGDSGIGRAVALAFPHKGADVLISYYMEPGGAIINTSSVETCEPLPILLPYATTKGAIVTFTKGLAKEAIKKGLRVNAVAPGPVWTPLVPMSMSVKDVATFGETTPMKRPAQPAELAPVYVLLASAESSYITSEVIGVTGGMVLG